MLLQLQPQVRISLRVVSRNFSSARALCKAQTSAPDLDFHEKPAPKAATADARLITNEYQHLRESYLSPKYPVMLCHGLNGFDSIDILPPLPAFSYWHGIKEALYASGVDVYTAAVAPTASIESRAEYLLQAIMDKISPTPGSIGLRHVNLVGHSMGGLDARYVISKLIPTLKVPVKVHSLTTIATPHRGSYIADLLVQSQIGPDQFPALYKLMPSMGFENNSPDGFKQLTTRFMNEEFNKQVLDDPEVAYFSYGARANPRFFNVFRQPWLRIREKEGDNDGMVSVSSARWGEYIGTINNVDHLDLVNFTNLLQYNIARFIGRPKPFNAIAMYLYITDMLAKKGY